MPLRRNLALCLLAALLLPAACQIHSPGQLELARQLLSRYTASFSDSLALTANLPAEEERLLATYRNNHNLISSTEELALLEANWTTLHAKALALNTLTGSLLTARTADRNNANTAATHLREVRKPLAAALAQLDKGLRDAAAAPTLADQLSFVSLAIDGAIDNAARVNQALAGASQAATAGGSPMDSLKSAAERLQPLAPNLQKYFQAVRQGPSRAAGQSVPLAVEATRLARDILAVEIDILDQEITYQEDLAGLAEETLRALPDKDRLPNLVLSLNARASSANARQPIASTLKILALQGDSAEPAIREILEDAGAWYYIQVQSARAKDTHELKSRILAYRQAKLLDLAYDRQRRALISYGLLAAVRYSEGGWKSQHTNNLLGLIQAGLQGGLLARF